MLALVSATSSHSMSKRSLTLLSTLYDPFVRKQVCPKVAVSSSEVEEFVNKYLIDEFGRTMTRVWPCY